MSKLRKIHFAIPAVLILLAVGFIIPTAAQSGPATDDEVNNVAKEIYCPVCENTPLDVCETQACADWRELIRTKLSEGESKQQIFDYFANQYGDRVLASPPREGFNLILWVGPIVAVIIGAFLFSRFMRRLRLASEEAVPAAVKSVPTAPAVITEPEDDYVNRIEKELADR